MWLLWQLTVVLTIGVTHAIKCKQCVEGILKFDNGTVITAVESYESGLTPQMKVNCDEDEQCDQGLTSIFPIFCFECLS